MRSNTAPYVTLGASLRAARHLKGFTQDELSYRTDLPVWRIRSFEQGRSQPTASQLATLASQLGCTMDAIMYGSVLVG